MGISNKEKEFTLNKDELERYKRHISLKEIGLQGQIKLKNSSVLFIGAGGIGSPAILYAAAAGISEIGVIDNDQIEKSNLQRQIIHNNSDLVKDKTDSAKKKIIELNPLCKVITFNQRLNTLNAIKIIKKFDIICDCSDNFATRYLINDSCLILNKPLIFGAAQGFEGQVSVFNLNNKSPNLRDLIPKPPKNDQIPSCNEFGIIGVSTGLIGILQVNEIIKIITNKGNILDGKILVINLLNLNIKKMNLKGKLKNKEINNLDQNKEDYIDEKCTKLKLNIKTLSSEEFYKLYQEKPNKIYIVDVREKIEFDKFSLKGSISIPLSELNTNNALELIKSNSHNKRILLLCQKGLRSEHAFKILMAQEIESISIAGGIEKIQNSKLLN